MCHNHSTNGSLWVPHGFLGISSKQIFHFRSASPRFGPLEADEKGPSQGPPVISTHWWQGGRPLEVTEKKTSTTKKTQLFHVSQEHIQVYCKDVVSILSILVGSKKTN